MSSVRRLLESEREIERRFVAGARANETAPKGWRAALIMFHIAQWRGRLRNAFDDVHAGRPYTPIPANIDELNDVELPTGAGLSLDEAATRADGELASLIELAQALGERPLKWDLATTSTEAVLRNSYVHPRNHIAAYLSENRDQPAAHLLFEEAASELRDACAPHLVPCVRRRDCTEPRQGRDEGRTHRAVRLRLLRTRDEPPAGLGFRSGTRRCGCAGGHSCCGAQPRSRSWRGPI